MLGLVGESGCGKSTLGRGVMGLLPDGSAVDGEVLFQDTDLLTVSDRQLRRMRGPDIALIFQEPMTRLNPLMRIEDHFSETITAHEPKLSKAEVRRRSLEALGGMGIPPTRFRNYPHEFSGGMRQRIMIALALVLRPKLVIADEPTTALDVLVEAQILSILADLKRNFDTALLLITHNLGIVAEACDRVAVMYAGRIAEEGDARTVFSQPAHPYTRELLRSVISLHTTGLHYIPGAPPSLIDPPAACKFHPRCPDAMRVCAQLAPVEQRLARRTARGVLAARAGRPDPRGRAGTARAGADRRGGGGVDVADADALLEVEDLQVHFPLRGSFGARLVGKDVGAVQAVDGVSFSVARGEVLGIVGESGSGKTTLGRALLRLVDPTGGSIRLEGEDVSGLREREVRAMRRKVQMVFQDPHASLNPAMTIETAVGHPLRIHGITRDRADIRRRVSAVLERVGLSPPDQYLGKYPSDLSGGQKQRAVLARAVILNPSLLVADEPVSMLDMSVRAKILELMLGLKSDLDLTYVYITHDLATAKFFCDRVAIMYLGRIVEIGATEEIFANPRHPYTQSLLRAIPDPDPSRSIPRDLPRGEVPDAAEPPLGCRFHPRCPKRVCTVRVGGA